LNNLVFLEYSSLEDTFLRMQANSQRQSTLVPSSMLYAQTGTRALTEIHGKIMSYKGKVRSLDS